MSISDSGVTLSLLGGFGGGAVATVTPDVSIGSETRIGGTDRRIRAGFRAHGQGGKGMVVTGSAEIGSNGAAAGTELSYGYGLLGALGLFIEADLIKCEKSKTTECKG